MKITLYFKSIFISHVEGEGREEESKLKREEGEEEEEKRRLKRKRNKEERGRR